jgi:hypothetical protein
MGAAASGPERACARVDLAARIGFNGEKQKKETLMKAIALVLAALFSMSATTVLAQDKGDKAAGKAKSEKARKYKCKDCEKKGKKCDCDHMKDDSEKGEKEEAGEKKE